jgi:HSP20 family protein
MRALTPLRPTRAVSTLRDAIDDLFFSHFFGDAEGWLGQRFDGRFAPATVVKDGAAVMRAGLPGIDPKSVDVTVHGDRLTITGERKVEREEHATGRVYREVRYAALRAHRAAAGPH